MLLPEQVVPFLQHPDRLVRNHALRYFRDTYNFGPLTADHYWEFADRLGEKDESLSFACILGRLPQTDASVRRLVQAIAGKSLKHFAHHYQHAVRDMEMDVLARHREEILGCPDLLPHVRKHLELRFNLLDESPATAFERLVRRGDEVRDKYPGEFDSSTSDALIEAAARGGSAVCEQAMATVQGDADRWGAIFAVGVLGAARYEPAIDLLVDQLAIDADVLREETNRALARIGTPQVIEKIVEFYPGKPWHARLYSNSPLASIKRPQSVDGLMKMLEVELAVQADPKRKEEGEPLIDHILIDLTELCSLARLEESRALIARCPDNPEVIDLCETLLATLTMTGTTIPEEPEWRKRIEKIVKEREARMHGMDRLFSGLRDNWIASGLLSPKNEGAAETISSPAYNSRPRVRSEPITIPAPIRNPSPKVGRNDPCPCGSGKKYKKCCGK